MDIFVLHLLHPKYDNMGAMAVTLAQTLGQNLGMMWNKHRSSAGIKVEPTWDPLPAALEGKRVSVGGGQSSTLPYSHPLTSQGTANVRTTGWAASWKTLGEFLGTS